MSHAENILYILAREERKREVKIQRKDSPIIQETLALLERSEETLKMAIEVREKCSNTWRD